MTSRRLHRHFCMMARALELIGERWSLLIVRDLLLGPKRFTDLARGLAGITPTRLTKRLRELEAAGIVTREPPTAGREVWYRLTGAGQDLAPVVEALTLWGIQHVLEPPRADEPVHPEPVMIGTKVLLDQQPEPPDAPIVWVWRFPGDERYTLRLQGPAWELSRGEAQAADVIVETTLDAWADFLTTPIKQRRLPSPEIRLTGKEAAIDAFADSFYKEPPPSQRSA